MHPDDGNAAGTTAPSPAPVPNNLGKPVSTEVGLASWYGPPYAGRKGADGTVYRVEAFAAPARVNAYPGGRWCVQIGAFARESDAVKLKQDLLRRYTTAKVIEFPGPTGYWVRVNPKFPDKRNATEVADGIHPKDPAAEPYLIRTD